LEDESCPLESGDTDDVRLVDFDRHCVSVAGHLILLRHEGIIGSLRHVDRATNSAAGSSSKNDVQAAPLPSGVSGW
jgi:hypothetical protein